VVRGGRLNARSSWTTFSAAAAHITLPIGIRPQSVFSARCAVLLLLGGPPRCGKTLLAQHVASTRGIGWLSTDTIRDVVNMLMPALYESGGPGRSPDPEADLFFPYFERVVESCNYLVDEYLIEGVGFMPRHVAALDDRVEVRPVFVGMKHVQLDSLLATEGRNRWHRELDEPTLATVPTWIESWSKEIERERAQLKVPYVELGDDFIRGIDAARRLLLGSGETTGRT
jgi:hypothetical protein